MHDRLYGCRIELVIFHQFIHRLHQKLGILFLTQGNSSAHEHGIVAHKEGGKLLKKIRENNTFHLCGAIFESEESHTFAVLCTLYRNRSDNTNGLHGGTVNGVGILTNRHRNGIKLHRFDVTAVFVKQAARKIHACGFLFKHQFFSYAEFRDIGIFNSRCLVADLPGHREHIKLTFKVILALLQGTLDHGIVHREQLTAILAKAIECASLDERFYHTAVELSRGKAVDKIIKRGEFSVLALCKNVFQEMHAHVFEREKSKADILARGRKGHTALVNVGRKNANTARVALADIFGNLGLTTQHACEQCRHILLRIVAFEICCAIRNEGICRGVRFVKRIVCKAFHIREQLLGNGYIHSPLTRTCNEAFALGKQHIRFLFRHCTAHNICVTKGIAANFAEDAHNLLLVNHATVG